MMTAHDTTTTIIPAAFAADLAALHALGQAARRDEELVDLLFVAFTRALAAPGARRPALRWSEVCHAALFGRPEPIEAALTDPDFLLPGDPLRAAKVGGLLLELGRVREADLHLGDGDRSLSVYHRRRLAIYRGDRSLSERLLGELRRDGRETFLGRVALAADALRARDLGPARKLIKWWDGPADMARMPSHLAAELVVLEIELRLAEGRRDAAAGAAVFFAAAPARYDASAILRATALLGPLTRRLG